MNRRVFLAASAAAGASKLLPKVANPTGAKRVLTLVYDRSLGMMRAIDKVVR